MLLIRISVRLIAFNVAFSSTRKSLGGSLENVLIQCRVRKNNFLIYVQQIPSFFVFHPGLLSLFSVVQFKVSKLRFVQLESYFIWHFLCSNVMM